MVPYDAKYDVARDNLAIYSGALGNVIDRLEHMTDADPREIFAYQQELDRVDAELQTMRPDDQALVNKANHIYARVAQSLTKEYLSGGKKHE